MSSRRARLGAATVAAVFLMVGATTAFAQDTPTTQPPTGTEGAGTLQTPAVPATPPEVTPETPPPPPTSVAPITAPVPEPAPTITPTPLTQPTTTVQPTTPAMTTTTAITVDIPSVPMTNPQGVVVPPQEKGPLTVGNFNAAVNSQAQHLRRLNQLGSIPGERITIINVANLSPSPATARIEAAVERAGTRSATSARAASASNASVSAALSSAGISAENVLAIAVRGHNLNDVTIYHR